MSGFVSSVGAGEVIEADVFLFLPALQEVAVRDGDGRAELRGADAVAAEVAEAVAQFAPCGEQADLFKVADGERPDGAVAGFFLQVGVGDGEAALSAQGFADGGKGGGFVGAVGGGADGVGEFGGEVVEAGRQDGADFGKCGFGCRCGGRFGTVGRPAHAEGDGFDFLCGEHEGRQGDVVAEEVADAGFAGDVGALAAQGVDVAVEGAGADGEFGGKGLRADGVFALAQGLHEVQEAFGAGHGVGCVVGFCHYIVFFYRMKRLLVVKSDGFSCFCVFVCAVGDMEEWYGCFWGQGFSGKGCVKKSYAIFRGRGYSAAFLDEAV